MKYTREIKVAALVIICAFLVFFGLHYLKGVNIFSKDNHYIGLFENVNGLKEQAPVYVRGYKVGQVDKIDYDYSQQQAFTVTISMHRDILLSNPTEMRLFDDGMLGGKAIEVVVPIGQVDMNAVYADGDTLPTRVVPGLFASLQEGLMGKVNDAIENIDSLVIKINSQIGDQSLKNTLDNVEQVTVDLVASAHDIKEVTANQLPTIMQHMDTLASDAKVIVGDMKQANLPATIARVDQTIDSVQSILTGKEGTLGLLLNDKALYQHVDSTIVSMDSLVTDLKKNPKRYVHFSLFDSDKKKNKKADK